ITLVKGNLFNRFLKIFWIIFAVPISTFWFMFFYPSMEKKSAGNRIDQELPFATIHMAAVSGSMIDPTNIFKIIIATGEYGSLEKEFVKLINEINIYGYDLVGALRRSAFNSPSKKLSELFNGLATTITSGGNLPEFFEKRSQSLLFEYRLEREKYTRSAETFMDIYISVVIAAPMILMLLFIMMSVSGLGISMGPGMISFLMILGVSMINVLFLTFLNLKQPAT
ncbi:MAG: type II secretion system F family protein, partial [Patescibacteria group bacterium]